MSQKPTKKQSLASLLAPTTNQSLFRNDARSSTASFISPQQLKNELVNEEESAVISHDAPKNVSHRENEYQARWRKRIEEQGGMESILRRDLGETDEESPHMRYQRQLLEQQRQKEITALKRQIERVESTKSVQERSKKRRRVDEEVSIKSEVKVEDGEMYGAYGHMPPQSYPPGMMPPPGYPPFPYPYPQGGYAYAHPGMPPMAPPPTTSQQKEALLTDFIDYGLSGLLYKGTEKQAPIKIFKWKPDERIREAPPDARWRLYLMRDNEAQKNPVLLTRSFVFFGADAVTVDVQVPHNSSDTSIGEQHAVVCFREKSAATHTVVPYIIDLESQGGTRVNGRRIEAARYYELRHGDQIQFGFSSVTFSLVDREAALRRP